MEVEDKNWAESLTKNGWQAVTLSARQQAICAYAEKLSHHPAQMSEFDINSLRQVGLEDAEILDVVQAASYFNYINRVADALGVPPEPEWG